MNHDPITSSRERIEILEISGVEGNSLYIDDFRVAGGKPWGGGSVVQKWSVPISELLSVPVIQKALLQHEAVVREETARIVEAQKSKLVDRETNFGMNEAARASLEDAAQAIRTTQPTV